jgi:hypothetical protein
MSVELPSIKFLRSPLKANDISFFESTLSKKLKKEDSQLMRISQMSP